MALVNVKDVERLIFAHLDFLDERQMARVNKYHRALFDEKFIRLFPYDNMWNSALIDMVTAGNLAACRWIYGRCSNPDRYNIFDQAARSGNVELFRWLLTKFSVSQKEVLYQSLIYALTNNHLPIAEIIFAVYPSLIPLLNGLSHYPIPSLVWMEQHYPFLDWSNQLLAHIRTLIEQSRQDLIQWLLDRRGATSLAEYWQLIRTKMTDNDWWKITSVSFLQWLEGQGAYDFSSHWDNILRAAVINGSLEMVRYALSRGGRISVAKWFTYGLDWPERLSIIQALYLTHPLTAPSEIQAAQKTQIRRYKPYCSEFYAWAATLSQ